MSDTTTDDGRGEALPNLPPRVSDQIGTELRAELDIDCPRCGAPTTVRIYGPCDDCRDVLRASQGGEGADIETPEYVPNMNVTPNAVALKD